MTKETYEGNMNVCPFAPLTTEAGRAHFEILNYRTPKCGIRITQIGHGSELHYYEDGSALITHPSGGDESFAFSSDAEERVEELNPPTDEPGGTP